MFKVINKNTRMMRPKGNIETLWKSRIYKTKTKRFSNALNTYLVVLKKQIENKLNV